MSTEPIRLHDFSIKRGTKSGRGKLENANKTTTRNDTENTNRFVLQTRHSDTQRLTQAQRDKLWADATFFSDDKAVNYQKDRTLIKGWADNDRQRAVGVKEAYVNEVDAVASQARINGEKGLASLLNQLARTAGSSRNCFVMHTMADARTTMETQIAAFKADAAIKGISAETDARTKAFTEGAAAMLDSNDKTITHFNSVVGLLKDAQQLHDENQNTDDKTNRVLSSLVNENTIVTSVELYSEGMAEDRSSSTGTYAGNADSWAAANFIVGG